MSVPRIDPTVMSAADRVDRATARRESPPAPRRAGRTRTPHSGRRATSIAAPSAPGRPRRRSTGCPTRWSRSRRAWRRGSSRSRASRWAADGYLPGILGHRARRRQVGLARVADGRRAELVPCHEPLATLSQFGDGAPELMLSARNRCVPTTRSDRLRYDFTRERGGFRQRAP